MLNICKAALALSALIATHVFGQQLPQQIRIIVPFAAGASTDAAARAVAAELAKRVGSNVIVENLPGASTFIGVAAAAKAPKDGSVLLMTSSSTLTATATKEKAPVDITTDMVPVAQLSAGPLLVAASVLSDIKTPAELLAAARAKPDQITHGTSGVGTLPHVAAELLNDSAGITLKHVPYKGGAAALIDLVAGRIDLMLGVYSTVASQVKAGRVRIVGVTTQQPHPSFPGITPMASVAPGLNVDVWVGFFAPLGTPNGIVNRLNAELNEVARSKAVLDVIAPDGSTPQSLSPEAFGARVRIDYAAWKKLASDKNIVVD